MLPAFRASLELPKSIDALPDSVAVLRSLQDLAACPVGSAALHRPASSDVQPREEPMCAVTRTAFTPGTHAQRQLLLPGQTG